MWKNLQIIGAKKNHGQTVEGFTIAKELQQFFSKIRRVQLIKTLSYNKKNTLLKERQKLGENKVFFSLKTLSLLLGDSLLLCGIFGWLVSKKPKPIYR